MRIHLLRSVLAQYERPSLLFSLYSFWRLSVCPYSRVLEYVPWRGRLLEVGCGFGHWLNYVALHRPELSLEGLDVDERRIRVARTSRNRSIVFRTAEAIGLPSEKYECITIIDVLYLVSPEAKLRMLAECYQALKPGGTLLVKEVDVRPPWKFTVTKLEQLLLIKLFGFTYSTDVCFWSAGKYADSLRSLGFAGVKVRRLDRWYLHPSVLIIGSRTEREGASKATPQRARDAHSLPSGI